MSKSIERRFVANNAAGVKLETRADTGESIMSGYGATFYDGGEGTEYELWNYGNERCVERIVPGAFDKAMSRPDDCRALFNHDPNMLLGRTSAGTLKLSVDAKGLAYEIQPSGTTCYKDTAENIRLKNITGSSFSFTVDEEQWTETKGEDGNWTILREIRSVTLYDVGPVTFPAYEGTSVGMRAMGDLKEARAAFEEYRKAHPREDKITGGGVSAYEIRARLVELNH